MTAAPFMAPLIAGLFFGRGFADSGAEHNPCGSELARDGGLTAGLSFVDCVHIRFFGNGLLWFRSYSGSL